MIADQRCCQTQQPIQIKAQGLTTLIREKRATPAVLVMTALVTDAAWDKLIVRPCESSRIRKFRWCRSAQCV